MDGQQVYLDPASEALVLHLGDIVSISCRVGSSEGTYDSSGDGPVTPSYIVFEVEGRIVQNSTQNTITVSYINSSSVTQGGMYTCMVDTGFSIISSNTSTLMVFSPIIIDHPMNTISATDGDRVQANCTATGFPRPWIEWYRLAEGANHPTHDTTIDRIRAVSVELPTDSVITNTTDEYSVSSSLVIPMVEYTGYGDYVCLSVLDYNEPSLPNQDNSSLLTLSIFTLAG